jgi:hypothetical protein
MRITVKYNDGSVAEKKCDDFILITRKNNSSDMSYLIQGEWKHAYRYGGIMEKIIALAEDILKYNED